MSLSSNLHMMQAHWPKRFRSICNTYNFHEYALLLKKPSLNHPPKGIRWIIISTNLYFSIKDTPLTVRTQVFRQSSPRRCHLSTAQHTSKYIFELKCVFLLSSSGCWAFHRATGSLPAKRCFIPTSPTTDSLRCHSLRRRRRRWGRPTDPTGWRIGRSTRRWRFRATSSPADLSPTWADVQSEKDNFLETV